MPWSNEDLIALEQSIKEGQLEVRYGNGAFVKYNSIPDMLNLRSTMMREMQQSTGSLRTTRVRFTRG